MRLIPFGAGIGWLFSDPSGEVFRVIVCVTLDYLIAMIESDVHVSLSGPCHDLHAAVVAHLIPHGREWRRKFLPIASALLPSFSLPLFPPPLFPPPCPFVHLISFLF